jgi:hypothetical protein
VSSTVEQPGGCEGEGAAADAQDPSPPSLGGPQGLHDARVDLRLRVAEGGDGDEVGVGGRLEPLRHDEAEPVLHGHDARVGRHDVEVERGSAVLAAVDAEDLGEDAELERGDVGDGDDGDLVEHGASEAWQESTDF